MSKKFNFFRLKENFYIFLSFNSEMMTEKLKLFRIFFIQYFVCIRECRNTHTHGEFIFGKCKRRNSNKNHSSIAYTYMYISYSHFSTSHHPLSLVARRGYENVYCSFQTLTARFHLTFTHKQLHTYTMMLL